MLLLLALLLSASNVALAGHKVLHAKGPPDTQQCPLCVGGTQPCAVPASQAAAELPMLANIYASAGRNDFFQYREEYRNQSPRAPPLIA